MKPKLPYEDRADLAYQFRKEETNILNQQTKKEKAVKHPVTRTAVDIAMSLLEDDMDTTEGVCLACEETQSGVEPDAKECECESCGAKAVYGAQEIVLMGAS